MILKSRINDNSYAWVKIPKTATRSYSELVDNTTPHSHMPYSVMTKKFGEYPCVTVVRDPYTRFVSSMRHVFGALNAQITHPHHVNHLIYSIPLNNTTNFCNFFYKFYDKNCISFDPMVHHKIAYHNIQMYHPFFQTQTSMIRTATNPLIFKYENLNEFNIWLETEIGIDTSKLSYVGKSEKIIPFNIDLESEEIKSLVKYLFEEDYVQFNYV